MEIRPLLSRIGCRFGLLASALLLFGLMGCAGPEQDSQVVTPVFSGAAGEGAKTPRAAGPTDASVRAALKFVFANNIDGEIEPCG